MCVAILQGKGKTLNNAQLSSGWKINSDGGGFAYIGKDGKVQIETGYLKYDDFAKAYERITDKYGENGPMLVHMRIRSAGGMGRKNCHPFRIKGGAMCHNGTMFYPDRAGSSKDDDTYKSDTRIFAEAFHNILDLASVKKAEEDIMRAVGINNKLLFLYDEGDYHIMNERAGFWKEGIWFSNGSCTVRPSYPMR